MRAAGSKISVVAALLVVSTACAPNYFPPSTFEENEEFDAFRRDIYSEKLSALREPALFESNYANRITYRFTWLRSFHRPVAVRIETDDEGVGTLYFKVADGRGGYDPGRLEISRRRSLTSEELESFEILFGEADICHPPSEPEGYLVVVTDGASWIFETRNGDNYCAFEEASPYDNIYRELGLRFLELAGFEASEDDPLY